MTELPEFDTMEELIQWVQEELSRRKSTNNKDMKEWIPVERPYHIDDFSYLFKDEPDD